MRRLILMLAMAFAVALGAEAQPRGVPAPTPADVRIHIGADQNGRTVRVPVGQRFAIELIATPTAGYAWEALTFPEFITRVEHYSGPTTEAQRQPGFAGGNHWDVLVLAALDPGVGDVWLALKRPWETSEAPVETFRVRIEAR
jgi:predicted secreted protein